MSTLNQPSYAELLSRAQALFSEGTYSQSAELFAQLTAPGIDQPTRSTALYGLGIIALNESRIDDAKSCLDESFSANPDNANSAYYLGVIAQRSDNTLEARQWFALAIAADPSHSVALEALVATTTTTHANSELVSQAIPAGNRPPNPPTRPHAIVGIAKAVRQQPVPWRGKPAAMVQLTFRVDVYAGDGTAPQGTVGVELRSHEINGSIVDGDWVELPIGFDPRKPGRIKEVLNLTTCERVFSKYRVWNAR